MNMDHRTPAFLCIIALFLLFSGCVDGVDNHVDQPDATMVQVTTPVSTPTPVAGSGDPIVGTWQWNSANDQASVVYVINADGTFIRNDYPASVEYRGNWQLVSSNKYLLSYQEPTPATITETLTYHPEWNRLYTDPGQFLDKTSE